jgi:hypothetical protein
MFPFLQGREAAINRAVFCVTLNGLSTAALKTLLLTCVAAGS